MSAYEQRVEPPDRRWQYLLFAAEPYETISFKVISVIRFFARCLHFLANLFVSRFHRVKSTRAKANSGLIGTRTLGNFSYSLVSN